MPPSKLGVQTALLSAFTAPAIVVASGVGDAFTSLLPAALGTRLAIVRRGYRLALAMSALGGLVVAVTAMVALPEVHGSIVAGAAVLIGTVIWALFTVPDSALTSLGRAHWLPFENAGVSIAKIGLLPALAAVALGLPLVVATLIPAVAAVAVIAPRVHGFARSADARAPQVAAGEPALAVRQLNALTRRTTASVALTLGALTLLPFVVTAVAGPAQGAVFALCLSITQSLDFVASALGVSLVVHGSARRSEAAHMARIVLLRSVVIVGAGALALVLIAGPVLRAMNPAYIALRGVEVITILAAASVVRTVFVTWSALQRARRAYRPILVLNSLGAVTLYTTLPAFCSHWGAVGAASALGVAQGVLSLGAAVHTFAATRGRRNLMQGG
jgi:hypothetical protein